MAGQTKDRSRTYLWFDTEYTSTELERARLLQVALVITDSRLRRILPPEQDLLLYIRLRKRDSLSPWVRKNLKDLIARCRSGEAVTAAEADRRLAERVDRAVGPPNPDVKRRPVLAGNSVHGDWFMARKFLPRFSARLHYRLLDVSAIKQQWVHHFHGREFDKEDARLVGRCFGADAGDLACGRHDAYYDVRASVAELRYYRERMARGGLRP